MNPKPTSAAPSFTKAAPFAPMMSVAFKLRVALTPANTSPSATDSTVSDATSKSTPNSLPFENP